MIFVRYPFPCDSKVLNFGTASVNVDQIEDDIGSYLGCNQFSLFYNGRRLQDAEVIPDNSTVHVTFPLPGGKGGFGSMLRAIGAQIEKTTNREACRDLSGRRLRDINEEQRLKKWIAKEAEREAEKVRRRQARIERLKSKPPHQFFDFEYEKEMSELPERVDEVVREGLQKAKELKKRPHDSKLPTKKKPWLYEDLPPLSSESDSEENNAEAEGSSNKKMKVAPKEISSCDSDVSQSSMSYPGSSKDSNFVPDESTSSNSKIALIEEKSEESSVDSSDKMDIVQHRQHTTKVPSSVPDESNSSNSMSAFQVEKNEANSLDSLDKMGIIQHTEDTTKDLSTAPDSGEEKSTQVEESKVESSEVTSVDKDSTKEVAPEASNWVKEPVTKDDSPIDLMDFQSISEFEALGLDRLKAALMVRGLKCGGTLSDRAQRLWKVRGLEPHHYPSNLLAKKKK